MAAILANLPRCLKRMAGILVINPDDGSYAVPGSDQEKYSLGEVTDALLQIDLEIVRAIQETVGHGYRSNYGTKIASVTYGMLLPGHPGKLGSVEVKLASGVWEPGVLAENLDVVRKVHLNPDGMYGGATENEGLYHIGEDLAAHYIGQDMRVFIPTELDITAVLQSPVSFEPTVLRGGAGALIKDPVDPNLQKYGQEYVRDIDGIHNGAMAVPALDSNTKAGG